MTNEGSKKGDKLMVLSVPLSGEDAEERILTAMEQARVGVLPADDIVRMMLEGELVRQAATTVDPPGYDRKHVRSVIEAELDRMNGERHSEPVERDEGGGAKTAEQIQAINTAVDEALEPLPDPQDIAERKHAAAIMKNLGKANGEVAQRIDYQGLLDSLKGHTYMEDAYNTYGYVMKTQVLESSLAALLKLNERGNYTEVMDKILEAFITLPMKAWDRQREYASWSHSLCHLYETYDRGGDSASLLNEQGLREANIRTINNAAQRMVEVGHLGCMPRIVIPLIRYNLDQVDPQNLDLPVALKPDGLEDEAYIKYLESVEGNEAKNMLPLSHAKTVRELLIGLVKADLENGRNYLNVSVTRSMPKLLKILENLRPAISIEELNIYMGKAVHSQMGRDTGIAKIGYEALKANVETAEKAIELCSGLYVDVDGTLLLHDDKKGLELNKAVLNAMNDAREMGVAVIIVTGGDTELKTQQLLELGMPETYLPVHSKYDYRGKILEVLLDDTAPDIQGLQAGSYHNAQVYFDKTLRTVREGEVICLKEERKAQTIDK